MTTLNESLDISRQLLSNINWDGHYNPIFDRMSRAQISVKNRMLWFFNYTSSTALFNHIYLASNWVDWTGGPHARAANLAHETRHLFQIDHNHIFKTASYLWSNNTKYEFEKYARLENVIYDIRIGRVHSKEILSLRQSSNPAFVSAQIVTRDAYGTLHRFDEAFNYYMIEGGKHWDIWRKRN